jgi:hypothetical protein
MFNGEAQMTSGWKVVGWVLPVVCLSLLVAPIARAGDVDAAKAMDDAKLTLSKAVESAETLSQGKAIAVHVKVDAKTSEVIVDCLVKDVCKEVLVDIKTGKATKVNDTPAKERKDEHLAKAKDIGKLLDSAKMSLVKIIQTAETSSKAKALSVKPTLVGDQLDMVVHCFANGKSSNVTVDGKTGKVGKTEEAAKKDDKKTDKKKDETKPAKPATPAKPTGKGGKGG